MSNLEVCADLRKRNKPYLHLSWPMMQSQFSRDLIKIENDLCKPITVKRFFEKFGYVGDWNNFEKE